MESMVINSTVLPSVVRNKVHHMCFSESLKVPGAWFPFYLPPTQCLVVCLLCPFSEIFKDMSLLECLPVPKVYRQGAIWSNCRTSPYTTTLETAVTQAA